MADGCQWIFGEPAGDRTRYCGRPVKPGKSYCPDHHAASIDPEKMKKAKRAGGALGTHERQRESARRNRLGARSRAVFDQR